ncbi:MAG: SMC-Scp complex subunit ScpB [Synechococcales cyanobacterium RU_4_20]|nr:SMC-Scp complex subunit ScpB [Synechococcales cyanobacterium RU_4_20]NJR69591.1 SMC-Scp complex subunit ScpB [Synechococcales cyanobacterium CRU_2_2]
MTVSLTAKIEAILYLRGQPLKLKEIAEYALCSKGDAEDALIQLMDNYALWDGALEVVEDPDGYSLQLRSNLKELIHTLVPVQFGVGVLRTLAAIALRKNLKLSELVELRGSGAYQHVQTLLEEGFIQKRNLKDSRSAQLRVTEKFHQYFEIEEIPQVTPARIVPKGAARAEFSVSEESSSPPAEALPTEYLDL